MLVPGQPHSDDIIVLNKLRSVPPTLGRHMLRAAALINGPRYFLDWSAQSGPCLCSHSQCCCSIKLPTKSLSINTTQIFKLILALLTSPGHDTGERLPSAAIKWALVWWHVDMWTMGGTGRDHGPVGRCIQYSARKEVLHRVVNHQRDFVKFHSVREGLLVINL